ncbi:unnamed protein product [Owenia fusiformis]|uniref:Uncharacterized protein n=1 Tax=Owenia fusiformis TaxID=6347 RepID=A0A8J1TRV1_OWEFU|nr:unnamed protein product [Owenia fusiformis]
MEECIIHGQEEEVTSQTVHEYFSNFIRAQKVLNKTALKEGESTYSFEELDAASDEIATRLLSGQGERYAKQESPIVCIMIPPSIQRICALFGILKSGAAYLPLDPGIPSQRLITMFAETDPICVVTVNESETENIKDAILQSKRELGIVAYDSLIGDNPGTNDEHITNGRKSELASVLYTSGSTGTPKGVKLTHRNIMNRLMWQWREFPFDDDDIGCHKTSLLFVDSLTEIFGSLLQGVPIVILQKGEVQNTETLLKILVKERVTRITTVPSLLKSIVLYQSMSENKLKSSMRLVISSGEKLPFDVAVDFFNALSNDIKLANLYGSTETLGDVTFIVFNNVEELKNVMGKERDSVPIGVPIANCITYLLDDNKNPVGCNIVGELYVSGISVTNGYVDSLKNNSFVPNHLFGSGKNAAVHSTLYRTGDFCSFKNGVLWYEGRRDSQIKLRGHRINTKEIERCARSIENIDFSVVLLCNEQLVLFYTTKTKENEDDKLLETLISNLPPYMLPKVYHILELPLMKETGKLDRKQLVEHYHAVQVNNPDNPTFDQTLSAIERGVIDVISGELLLQPSGSYLNMNFFKIGGNSLNAISTIVKLKIAGYSIDFADFLESGTIGDVVERIKRNDEGVNDFQSKSKRYTIMPMTSADDNEDVIPLVAKSFSTKVDLDVLVDSTFEDLELLVKSVWKELIEEDLSLVVRDNETNKIVAAALILDIRSTAKPLFLKEAVGAILEDVDLPVREKLLQMGGDWLDSFMISTDTMLPHRENMVLLHMIEEEVLKLAKTKGCRGILSVNAHQVTMDLDEHYYGYTVEKVIHVKSYKWNGTTPFEEAKDDYYLKTMVKYL